MAWTDKLAMIFGANPQTTGLLGPEATRAAAMQGLLGAGTSLLQASGPSHMPQGTAAALGSAVQAGQQGFQGAVQNNLQTQDLSAQRDMLAQEKAAREELQKLLASGQVTDEALLRIATQFPQASNVIQQYMKGRQAAAGPQGPSEMVTRELPDGSTVFWDGKRWQRAAPQRAAAERIDPNMAKIEALRSLGIPDDQIATALGVKPPGAGGKKGGAEEVPGGFNDRQRGGAAQAAQAALNYAAALTGKSPTELAARSPEEVEKLIASDGNRLFQGPVMGEVPFLSDRVNSDLFPFAESMAAAQALVNNPAGPVTKPDVDTARVTVPNPRQPREVQAKLIRNLLEQAKKASGVPSAATTRKPVRSGIHQGRRVIEYDNGDIEYAD